MGFQFSTEPSNCDDKTSLDSELTACEYALKTLTEVLEPWTIFFVRAQQWTAQGSLLRLRVVTMVCCSLDCTVLYSRMKGQGCLTIYLESSWFNFLGACHQDTSKKKSHLKRC